MDLSPETSDSPAKEESKQESDDSLSELKRNIPPTSIVRSTNAPIKAFTHRVRDGEIQVDLKNIQ